MKTSQNNWTPGPWTLGKGRVTIRETSKPGREGFIARCHMPGEYRVRSEEEAEANARLIAAAPSMFEALENILISHKLNSGKEIGIGPISQARAAINLATGQEP